MKLTATLGSTGGLVGCGVPTIAGLACSATAATTSTPATGLSFSSKTDLEKFNGGLCVDTLLSPKEKELLNRDGINKDAWQSQEKFKNPTGESKGCLAVSWDKQTWNDGYWQGTIRYEWMFSKGAETMVVHGFINSEETGIGENWKAIYINTSIDKKTWQLWSKNVAAQGDLATKMPKRPGFFSGSGDYWSFNPEYSKSCQKGQGKCLGSPRNKHFESTWKWTGNSGGSHLFSSWASNYSSVFDEHLESLKELVAKEKGTWESF